MSGVCRVLESLMYSTGVCGNSDSIVSSTVLYHVQHTANTLQHAATHCTILQHFTTQLHKSEI